MLKPNNGPGRTAPLSSMTDAGGKYSYAKPTDKPQNGKPTITSNDIADYNLPVVDVQSQRRNYPGYTESQYYSDSDVWAGDSSGITETDSRTETKSDGGYTRINTKRGPSDRWPDKRS